MGYVLLYSVFIYCILTVNSQCPDEWKYFEGSQSCYRLFEHSADYFDAKYFCRKEHGADLVSVHSIEEANFLKSIPQSSSSWWFYTGLEILKAPCERRWSDGSSPALIDTLFDEQQPTDCARYRFGLVNQNSFTSTPKFSRSEGRDTAPQTLCKKRLGPDALVAPNTCEIGWESHGAKCYKMVSGKFTYDDSLKYCTSMGATMVSIKNEKELEYVKKKITELDPNFSNFETVPYMSLKSAPHSCLFKWADGRDRDMNMFEWIKDEPDDCFRDSDCAILWPHGQSEPNMLVADRPCNIQQSNVMCEKKKNKVFVHCDYGWNYNSESKSCYKVKVRNANYKDSAAFCKVNGATLATFKSSVEREIVKELIRETLPKDASPPFIGLHSDQGTCTFTWTNGAAWDKEVLNFAKDHPKYCWKAAACATMSNTQESSPDVLIDTDCNQEAAIILCQKPSFEVVRHCEPGWSHFAESNTCYKVENRLVNYAESQRFCKNAGGTLAIFKTPNEREFVKEILLGAPGMPFVGLMSSDSSCNFKWIDGTSLNRQIVDWAPKQPNGCFKGEHCAILSNIRPYIDAGSKILDDVPCAKKVARVVCQKPSTVIHKVEPKIVVKDKIHEVKKVAQDDTACRPGWAKVDGKCVQQKE